MNRLKHSLRALRHRNYRFYFFGTGASFIGTWMHRIALSWLAYRLTDSSKILGLVSFVTLMPSFILSPIAGAMCERWDRRKILIATQILAMCQTIILFFLVALGMIEVWHILVLGSILGIIIGFDLPIRQAFVSQVVESKEDLGNAIALNSLLFNSARLIGPAIAGYIITSFNESMCFLMNSLSYGILLMALLRIKVYHKTEKNQYSISFFTKLKEGIVYAYSTVPIRLILYILCIVSLMAMPYFTLAPVFARDILHGNANTLGLLMTVAGVGAVCGGSYLISRISIIGLENVVIYAVITLSAGMIILSQSTILIISMGAMYLVGGGLTVVMASCNTILQSIVDDDKRGRVMSFYSMTFLGLFPIGSLLSGEIAEKIGAPATLCIQGLVCLISIIIIVARYLPIIKKMIIPIYKKKGLIVE